eukprot:4665390-Pyramimonas_sp.AAC.1
MPPPPDAEDVAEEDTGVAASLGARLAAAVFLPHDLLVLRGGHGASLSGREWTARGPVREQGTPLRWLGPSEHSQPDVKTFRGKWGME